MRKVATQPRALGPDRRDVLKLLAALSVSSSSVFGLVRAPRQEAALQGSLETSDFGDLEVSALRDLAKAYEESGAEDTAGVEAMVERLRKSGLGDDELIEPLRQEMRDDFAAGRTANVYGWMISRTEARVLAAAAGLLS